MSDAAASVDVSSVPVETDPSAAEAPPVPELPGQLTFGWGDVASPGKSRKRNLAKKSLAAELKTAGKSEDATAKRGVAKQKKKKTVKLKPVKSVSRRGSKKSKAKQVQAAEQAPIASTIAEPIGDKQAVKSQTAKLHTETDRTSKFEVDSAVAVKQSKKDKPVGAKPASEKVAERTVTKKKKPVRKATVKAAAVKSAPAVEQNSASQKASQVAIPEVTSKSVEAAGVTEDLCPIAVVRPAAKSSIKSYADTVGSLPLKWGAKLPSVGFGFWKVEKEQAAQVCYDAIQVGYRHLDCACDYGNEAEVGQGIQRAIQDGLVDREDLWVTSKLWNTYHSPEHVRMACEKSLSDLQLDYLDLYLIHFPLAQRFVPIETRYPPGWFFDPDVANPVVEEARVSIQETWRALEELAKEGLVQNIGVCNFGTSQIRDLLTYAHIRPAVLQVETHPRLTQPKLLKYCQQEKIAYTSFSPLGAQSYYSLNMANQSESLLKHPVVAKIAGQVERTAAQVLLRWGVQRGTAVIPKTSSQERMVENIRVFDFELTHDQMQHLDGLDEDRRFNDPGDFGEAAFNTYLPIYE